MADDNQGSRTFLAIVLGGIVLALVIAAFFMYGHKGDTGVKVEQPMTEQPAETPAPPPAAETPAEPPAERRPPPKRRQNLRPPSEAPAEEASGRRGAAAIACDIRGGLVTGAAALAVFPHRDLPLSPLRSSEVQGERSLVDARIAARLSASSSSSGKQATHGA